MRLKKKTLNNQNAPFLNVLIMFLENIFILKNRVKVMYELAFSKHHTLATSYGKMLFPYNLLLFMNNFFILYFLLIIYLFFFIPRTNPFSRKQKQRQFYAGSNIRRYTYLPFYYLLFYKWYYTI